MNKTNEERFRELYWKYQNLVLHVAVAKTGNYHAAQDICQDTFVKMMKQLDLGIDDEEIRAWLVTVAHNAARDYHKKGGMNRRNLELDFEVDEVKTALAAEHTYFGEIFRRDFRVRILDELRRSNEEYYNLIVLTCCMQLSVTEAAQRLNISYNEATKKLHRARTWLRNNFGEEYKELKF